MEISFHPYAVKRFNDLAENLRERVRVVRKTVTDRQSSYAPYPVAKLAPQDLIGQIAKTEHIVDGLGNEVGRVWTLRGESVGLLHDGYEDVKKLAKALEKTSPLRNRVGAPLPR